MFAPLFASILFAPLVPPLLQEAGANRFPDPPAGIPPAWPNPTAEAKSAKDMQSYEERIPGTQVKFSMTPISGGKFLLGSPPDEEDRRPDEGPRVEVQISPFWMGTFEVTWDEYQLFQFQSDRAVGKDTEQPAQDAWADAVSRPTPPYVPMDFGMGIESFPAICMTQFAAKQYTKWLSMKTGRFHRLPTEAEWEYACRAGTTTAWSFGDNPDLLEDYAWFFDNGDDAYHPVGELKPNPWGLFDMHGNVAEWCLDGWYANTWKQWSQAKNPVVNPIRLAEKLYPRVVRGGSWDADPEQTRSAFRRKSGKDWKVQDPQLPKSIWYLTDAAFVGFRIVRPLKTPPAQDWERFWAADLDSIRTIQEKQRKGER